MLINPVTFDWYFVKVLNNNPILHLFYSGDGGGGMLQQQSTQPSIRFARSLLHTFDDLLVHGTESTGWGSDSEASTTAVSRRYNRHRYPAKNQER